MNVLRVLAAVVGVAVLAATAALVFGVVAPAESLSTVTDSLDEGQYLLGLAGTLLLAGLWLGRRRGSSTKERFIELRESPPEAVAAPASIRVGGEFDRLVADAVESEDESGMAPVVAELRRTATGLYADETGVNPETARRRVRDGAWTDDRLAASFLGEGPPPLRSRIRAWLDPARERRRRLDAALDALFELREGSVPPVADDRQSGDERNRSWVARVTDGGRRR